jgi:hypothetical protein
MKHLVGYSIWNKAGAMPWLLGGIKETFTPDKVDLLFVLDNPIDGTDTELIDLLDREFKDWNHKVVVFNEEKFKFPIQNWMMRYCMEMEYKSLIAPQDDQRLTDPQLLPNLEKLFEVYGTALGCIGLRDGFGKGYSGMFSSTWSESVISTVPRLQIGEYREVEMLNDGPLIYPLHLIKAIGYNDITNFKWFYIEDDYCMRALEAGYKNIVMGNSLIHHKVRASFATIQYDNTEIVAADLAMLKQKWNW